MDTALFLLFSALLAFLFWDRFFSSNSTDAIFLAEKEAAISRAEGRERALLEQQRELKNTVTVLEMQKNEMQKKIADLDARKEQQQSAHNAALEKLEKAVSSFQEEKNRLQRKDEDEQRRLFLEKNRRWAEHEKSVLARLRETCRRPEMAFSFFENTALPPEFDGHFRPDFLVDFLGEYLYFDAKFSDHKDPNTYFSAAKLAGIAGKCKEHNIYSTIFFVVPSDRLSEIRKTSFYQKGFSFFLIAPEAIEPILANYKKITEYENLAEFSPEDREKITRLLAQYDRHLSFRNAVDMLMSRDAGALMASQKKMATGLFEEIAMQKQKIGMPKPYTKSEVLQMTEEEVSF